ncbi:hypothetical protein [Pseudohongiella sp. O18]|uniref:hypothetical protein n=1 Tax=Pseudohongiella sp. O18 TaxID=2904248 RepID=UPI001F300BB2|nr:hypothetical protein [Pseudohongiella sp. O18]
MKFEFRKSTLIKLGLILVLIAVAPFLVPFTLEFIIVADLVGLEALIVFLFAYGKSIFNSLKLRIEELSKNITHTARLVSELYMFKPTIFFGHATVSSIVMVLACSVLLACSAWVPVMLMSSVYMT